MDDQIETLYMKKISNSDWIGFLGIRKKYGLIFRPMLMLFKKEIITYANKQNLTWIDDLSNNDTRLLRNKIRLQILPKLIRKEPSLSQELLDMNRDSIVKYKKLEKSINSFFNIYIYYSSNEYVVILNKTKYILDLVEFKVFYKTIISRLLKINKNFDFSNKYWKELYNFILNSSTGSKFYIDSDFTIIKGRNKHYLFKNKFLCKINPYKLKYNSINKWYDTNLILNKKLLDNKEVLQRIFIPKSTISRGLKVRNWENGDKIFSEFYKANIRVKKIFINNKISKFDKSIFPILTDLDNSIICIPGLFNKNTNTESSTKIYWTR